MSVEYKKPTIDPSHSMGFVRFYGSAALTIIGFDGNEGGLPARTMEYLAANGHKVWDISDSFTIPGSLSLHHMGVFPPLDAESSQELADKIILTDPITRDLPYGLGVFDNRVPVEPLERSYELYYPPTGKLLGSVC